MNELYNILKLKCEQGIDRLAGYEGFPVEKINAYDTEAQQWIEIQRETYGDKDFLKMSAALLVSEAADLRHRAWFLNELGHYLLLSLCHYHLALFKQDRGLLADACEHLQDAHYYCGAMVGMYEYCDWRNCQEEEESKRTEKATKAGGSRGTNYAPVKVELIRLLRLRASENKWETVEEAIKGVYEGLCTFIEKESKASGKKPVLKYENLPRTLRGWYEKHDDIKVAFEEAVTCKR